MRKNPQDFILGLARETYENRENDWNKSTVE